MVKDDLHLQLSKCVHELAEHSQNVTSTYNAIYILYERHRIVSRQISIDPGS